MKLSLTLPVFLAALDGAIGSATDKLMQNARRVEYNYQYNKYNRNYYEGAGGGDEEDAFLGAYSMKMLACVKGEQAYNYRDASVETSTVVFRLCPAETCGADNSTSAPCEEGYGDFAVGINTFAQAYMESVKDNYNNNGQYYSYDYGEFNVEEYTRECRLFEGGEGGQNQNYNGNYGYQYDYIGLACTDDGADIKLTSFSDPYCTTESQNSFESTHNGYSLPFGDGGMIPDTCMSCMQMNDNYEYELGELCKMTYENANYKCETDMEYTNYYYGPDTRGCDFLKSYVPKASRKSSSESESFSISKVSGGNVVVEYLLLLVFSGLLGATVVGLYYFFVVEKKSIKNLGESGAKASTSIVESVKSGAMFVKMAALSAFAKITAMVKKSDPEGGEEYSNMDDGKKSNGPQEEHC